MRTIVRMLPAFCLLLQTTFVYAETASIKNIHYQNQREEIFDLENFLKEIEYKDEEVKDTCTKKVPYEEKVCKDVTKYKKECKTIPAHEECKDVNKPICHNETRNERVCEDRTRTQCRNVNNPVCHSETKYETVCTDGRPEQQCRTVNEPYCHNETRYRNECHTVPGEQQCRVVIRYHEECNNVPGGRQCRTVPGDIRCRIINGENKCEKIPPREECTDAPSRRECSQKPYEERECSAGPSRQECRQVPYQEQVCENRSRQECTTVPGRQECRQVPRSEQVCVDHYERECEEVPTGEQDCRNVPRTERVCEDHYEKECKNVPAKEECKNIPYKENVCKMETKYKDEQYECTKTIQVPHEVIKETYKAHVQMEFNASAAKDTDSNMSINLTENGTLTLAGRDNGEKNLLIFALKEIKEERIEDVKNITALFKINLIDKNEYFLFLKNGIQDIELHSRELKFKVDGKIDLKKATLQLAISKKGEPRMKQTTLKGSDLEAVFDGKQTTITVDLEKAGASKLGGVIYREHNVQMKLNLDYSGLGQDILTQEKEYSVSTYVKVNVE